MKYRLKRELWNIIMDITIWNYLHQVLYKYVYVTMSVAPF